jgi:c-di-GMP-related signal transduction protein
MPITEAYVARQPILDRHKKIVAYELLFRDGNAAFMPDIDGDEATHTVLSNAFLAIGLDTLIGNKKAFINFTENLLKRKIPMLLPKESVVIEILEDVNPTPDLITACSEMIQNGYTLALDDFTYTNELEPLIAMAGIIKVDFRQTSLEDIQRYSEKLPCDRGLSLLAEKVETYEEFNAAMDMGFELFQGYFFCKPELVNARKISGSQLSLLRIISEVNKSDFALDSIETMIAPDVSLSYKLLRYINSAFFTKAQAIASIKQALVYMGKDQIRRFVSLAAMAGLAKGKPDELLRTACIRGKFCELLAGECRPPASPAELFTLGIFSLIDAIMDQPMNRVLQHLPLSEKIKQALIQRQGVLIGYLTLVEIYESGQWEYVDRIASALKADEDRLPKLYAQACRWSNDLMNGDDGG